MKNRMRWLVSLCTSLAAALVPIGSQAQPATPASHPPTLTAAAATATSPSAAAPSSAADSTVVRQIDVMVPARDGVLLATDIYRPAKAGIAVTERLPVLLHRTPFDKSEPSVVAIAEEKGKKKVLAVGD